ncbi:hypothetical protein [Ferviditalea candida]|uniref:Uncharacterized protein n=1 Tax=Ferviditalea candida TaxID=3108399 RepID=A0ABU5ZG66_9BACL|nr:hypothetical protein [Paenibacillaceae bacterium T2]
MPDRNDSYSDSDNNGQRRAKERGGEHRSGRLSGFKNSTSEGGAYPTEYTSRIEEEQEPKE